MSEINQKARIKYLQRLITEYRTRAEKAEGLLAVAQSSQDLEPVAFINARLTDLAEANALYGKDQRLNAPDKIARNDREISWLKDLRSLVVSSTHCGSGK